MSDPAPRTDPPPPSPRAAFVRTALAAVAYWTVALAMATVFIRLERHQPAYALIQIPFDALVVIEAAGCSLLVQRLLQRLAASPLWQQAAAAALATLVLGATFEWGMRLSLGLLFPGAMDSGMPRPTPANIARVTVFWIGPFGLWAAGVLAVLHQSDARRQAQQLAEARAAADAAAQREVERPAAPSELWVQRRGEFVPLRVEAIDWVEAERDYVRLHAGGESYLIRHTLGALQAKLGADRFLRVRRSALVRADRVAAIRNAGYGDIRVRLLSGEELRVGRTYVKEFRALLALPAGETVASA